MWNPANPTRLDHPAHHLVGELIHNPFDDLDVHPGSPVVNVDPRASMSLLSSILTDWAKVRELRQLALNEQFKGMDGFAKID